jgi:hypothetical protein
VPTAIVDAKSKFLHNHLFKSNNDRLEEGNITVKDLEVGNV